MFHAPEPQILAAPRSEHIGKTKEVLLLDGLQNVHDCLLDDLVLQAQNAQWPLGTVRLRDVCPSGRPGSVTAPMHAIVQVFQFLFEVFSIGLPRHAIDPGRSITREREIAPLQEVDGDVMQQCGEPYVSALSRRLAHGCQSVRRGIPAQCPGRGRLTAVPLGRGPSLRGLRRGNALLVRPLHRYNSLVRLLIRVHAHRSAFCLHEPVRHALPDTDEASQVPCKELLRVRKVSDCARLLHPQAICAGRMLPSRQRTRSAPRNSTRFAARYPARGLPCERFTAALASRNLVHHSGPGRLARPYPVEDLHLLSFASFPGALGIWVIPAVELLRVPKQGVLPPLS